MEKIIRSQKGAVIRKGPPKKRDSAVVAQQASSKQIFGANVGFPYIKKKPQPDLRQQLAEVEKHLKDDEPVVETPDVDVELPTGVGTPASGEQPIGDGGWNAKRNKKKTE